MELFFPAYIWDFVANEIYTCPSETFFHQSIFSFISY